MVAVLRFKGNRGFAPAVDAREEPVPTPGGSAAARLGRCAWVRALALVAGTAPLIGCRTPASGPSTGDGDTRAAALPMDGYVRLERGAHPLARPAFDLGPLDPNRRIANLSVVFKLSPAQQIDRDALIAAQLDRTSPSYRKWLTPEQYADRFGAKARDIARTRAWLAQQGLDVRFDLAPRGARELCGARRGLAEGVPHGDACLQGRKRHSLRDVHGAGHPGRAFRHRARGAQHPRLLRATGEGSDDDGPRRGVPDRRQALSGRFRTRSAGLGDDLRRDPALCDGGHRLAARRIGDRHRDRRRVANRAERRRCVPHDVRLARVDPHRMAGAGHRRRRWFAGGGTEAILDTEWSGAIAPGASIRYVFTGSDDANIDSATYYAIEQNLAPILSQSAGACELNQAPSDADVLGVYGSAANLLGMTFVAASGDAAATGCIEQFGQTGLYVQFPASFPGVTAVGGTEFPTHAIAFDCNGFATGYPMAEQVWNETNPNMGPPNGGGGGISEVFPRPPYQSTTCAIVGSLPVPLPAGTTPSGMRQVPDIALSASADRFPHFIECTPVSGTTDCSATGGRPVVLAVGGTSAATPSFAGVLALVDEAIGGRLGNVNPELYALDTTAPSAFHDITAGNNLVGCTRGPDPGCPTTCPVQGFPQSCYGYQAAAGYDCASGLGSIDAANLVRAWLRRVRRRPPSQRSLRR